MFGLPNLHHLWTSQETKLAFVELLGRPFGHARYEYMIVAWLPSGYVNKVNI